LCLHFVARFVVQARQGNPELKKKFRARGELLFEHQRFATRILDATNAEISENDDEEEEKRAADKQRHQRRIKRDSRGPRGGVFGPEDAVRR